MDWSIALNLLPGRKKVDTFASYYYCLVLLQNTLIYYCSAMLDLCHNLVCTAKVGQDCNHSWREEYAAHGNVEQGLSHTSVSIFTSQYQSKLM